MSEPPLKVAASTLLTDVSWIARMPIAEACVIESGAACNEDVKSWRHYDLDKTLPIASDHLCLSLPVDRYRSLEPTILKFRKRTIHFTAGEILDHIHRFYCAAMTKDELERVAKTDDVFGYARRAQDALANNTVLYREQVMGDCMYFEGLKLDAAQSAPVLPTYSVLFGS